LAYYCATQTCPQCGQTGQCFAKEIKDSMYYYDEYTFHCPACGYTKRQRIYKGSTISGTQMTICPFCNEKNRDHQRTPQKFLPNPAKFKQDFLCLPILTI